MRSENINKYQLTTMKLNINTTEESFCIPNSDINFSAIFRFSFEMKKNIKTEVSTPKEKIHKMP